MAYLDHAATTPMLPESVQVYAQTAAQVGNASSLHAAGRSARRRVEEARECIAACLGAGPFEVVFTAGGTESDNLAVKGIFWARRAADPRRTRVVAGAIEHHAVLDAVTWLHRHEGADVSWLPVDEHGRLRMDHAAQVLAHHADQIAVVTVMWANNEVGTVQPVAELAALCAPHGIPLHTDAIQAVGQLPVDFATSGAAAMTVTGHKLGGPTGVGALLLGREVACTPLLHGGGQEREVRSGTLDVPGIVAFAAAVEHAVKTTPEHAVRLAALRDDLVARVRSAVPDAQLNGDPARRLPSNAHFSFPGCEGDDLLLLLDAAGICCSTGSACSAGIAQPSHVLLAMGADADTARSSLRFTVGHTSRPEEIDELIAVLPGAVDRARGAGRYRLRGEPG